MGAIKDIWTGLMSIFTLISRVMKLEDRVSDLEKKVGMLQTPPRDIRQELEYVKEWNYYINNSTGECFCPNCLGHSKRITVVIEKFVSGPGWVCQTCNARYFKPRN
jgi:hypothetical protein